MRPRKPASPTRSSGTGPVSEIASEIRSAQKPSSGDATGDVFPRYFLSLENENNVGGGTPRRAHPEVECSTKSVGRRGLDSGGAVIFKLPESSPRRTKTERSRAQSRLRRPGSGDRGRGKITYPFSVGRAPPYPINYSKLKADSRQLHYALVLKSLPIQPLARINNMQETIATQPDMNHIVVGSIFPRPAAIVVSSGQ